MIDQELERNQAWTYRYQEADQYTLITRMRRIPLSKYTPEDAYGERAYNTAFELNELGALMTIFIPQDSLLRRLVETTESEDDFTKRSLRQMFLFLDEHPAAVKKKKNGFTSTDSTRSEQTVFITEEQKPKWERGFCAHGWIRPSSNAMYALWGIINLAEWIQAQNCCTAMTADGVCSDMCLRILKCQLEDIY